MGATDEILFAFTVSEIARLCGVSLRTAERWRSRNVVVPPMALTILNRDLGCFHPAWTGWRIGLDGSLISPENWLSSPGDVRWIELARRQLGDYRRENRKLKEIIDLLEHGGLLEDQPLPSDWEYSESSSA